MIPMMQVPKNAKFIMRNHRINLTPDNESVYEYIFYSEDWEYIGRENGTAKQAINRMERFGLVPVSPMDVYRNTQGTM